MTHILSLKITETKIQYLKLVEEQLKDKKTFLHLFENNKILRGSK